MPKSKASKRNANIIRLYKYGIPMTAIARQYKISKQRVFAIVKRANAIQGENISNLR